MRKNAITTDKYTAKPSEIQPFEPGKHL
jgi:hypothetical protein